MMTWGLAGLAVAAAWLLLRRLSTVGLAVVTAPGPLKLEASTAIEAGSLACTVLSTGSGKPLFVESISAARAQADPVGLGTPAGFDAEPMPTTPRDDAAWVAQWNRENVRFAGRLALPPGQPVRIVFPLSGDGNRPLVLQCTVTNGRSVMGSMRFLRIRHGEVPASTVLPSTDAHAA